MSTTTTNHHNPRNYVLLLRHCVRATRSTIKVCDRNRSEVTTRAINISDYTSVPLPQWGVPEMWCTESGLDIIKKTGSYFINQVLKVNEKIKHVDIRLISDTSQRDVDTTMAISLGMKEALLTNFSSTVSFSGLDQVLYSPGIFGPEKIQTGQVAPLCPQMDYSLQELADEIAEQSKKISLSEEDIESAFNLTKRIIGDGEAILSTFQNDGNDHQCPTDLGMHLNLLKAYAEMLFYSRASDIDPPFLPAATEEDVYKLLDVSAYIHSSTRLNNIRAAKGGLVLAKSMLEALKRSSSTSAGLIPKDTIRITMYVGHDTNIDAVASALGLRWTLPPPYLNGQGLVFSPPGSGLLFVSSDGDDSHTADISSNFLFPTFMNDPVEFQLAPVHAIFSEQFSEKCDELSGARDTKKIFDIRQLECRLSNTLRRYPSLSECYNRAPIVLGPIQEGNRNALDFMTMMVLSSLIINITFLCMVWYLSNKMEKMKPKNDEEIQLRSYLVE